MAKLKYVAFGSKYIPKINVPTEDGEIPNREQPKADMITTMVSLAPIEDKSRYLGSYIINELTDKDGETNSDVLQKEYTEWMYNECVAACCSEIKGLESLGIKDGKTLVEHEDHPFLQHLIQDIFMRACAVRKDSGVEDDGELPAKKD